MKKQKQNAFESIKAELEKLEAMQKALADKKKQLRAVAASEAPLKISGSEFKGHPMVSFEREGSMPWSLSVKKIKTILDNADKIRKIVG